MPSSLHVLLRIAHVNSLIARIPERKFLLAVQQFVRDIHVGSIRGRGHQRVRQTGLGVHADVGIRTEVPVIAFLRCWQ